MKQTHLQKYMITGVFFVSIIGTLSHFVYEWSGENFFLGLFFPVNESTWEHMKMLFFPMLLYSTLAGTQLKRENPCLRFGMLAGILAGTALIPIFFYTYSGILGFYTTFLDVVIFYLSIICAFYLAYHLTKSCKNKKYFLPLSIAAGVVFILFLIFTYLPPELGIFAQP